MDRYDSDAKFQLSLYFLPIVGALLAGWTIIKGKSSPQHQKVCRISVNLTLVWLAIYITCWESSNFVGEIASLRLLYGDALVTTGYFAVCLWLAFRIWRDRSQFPS
jgi:uncharacterized membrane protein YozB (DUF420 family)